MVFLDNVLFVVQCLPSPFLLSPLPWHSIVWSKNTTCSAAKALKSLCMVLLFLSSLYFFPPLIIYLSCIDFVFLSYISSNILKITVQDTLSAACFFSFYSFFSFLFKFRTVLFPWMTKQHRQEWVSRLPACAMIQQVVKGRNVFFFWERVGENEKACVTGVCATEFDFLVLVWSERSILLSCELPRS